MVLLRSAIFQKAQVKNFPHVYLFFPQTNKHIPISHRYLPSLPRFLCTAKNCLFVIVASISCSFRANLRFEPSGLCCVWACLHPWVWMELLQVLIQIQLQAERPLGAGTLETKQKVLASRAAECVCVCVWERVWESVWALTRRVGVGRCPLSGQHVKRSAGSYLGNTSLECFSCRALLF